MLNMNESKNLSRQLFVEWIPQIVFNHHQPAPAGTVVVGPPYRDPFNYVYDPILMTSLDALGAAIHTRLNVEDKPGYGQRGSSPYSTWWNGGLRTTVYFHNMIGILTEIIGGPTPHTIPLVPDRLLPRSDSPNPVLPQKWHFRQSIDYSISMNYAVLNYAARHRDELLFNIYRMGRNNIERGSQDNWSFTPNRIDLIHAAYRDTQRMDESASLPSRMEAKYLDAAKAAGNRDPRAFLISADQPDWPTTVRFLNALVRSGVVVHRATEPFSLSGKDYPGGSYVIKTAQAFRPHVLDMFEPQDHPDDFKYEGGPPIPPYDAAGWTPAFLMGIEFDRVLDDFSAPLEPLGYGELIGLPQAEPRSAAVYQLPAESNNSYIVVNELLKSGDDVYRDTESGDFYVPLNSSNREKLYHTVRTAGVMPRGIDRLTSRVVRITPARVAIWDRYGGSMPSGWVRWIMEEYGFDFSVVYPPDIDAGELNARYDAIVFVGGAIPASEDSTEQTPGPEAHVPALYANRVGSLSIQKSVPELRKFLQKGGRIITIGSSAHLARYLGVPMKDALTEWVDGRERPLSAEKFYIPGSVLKARLAEGIPATWGMERYVDVYFDESPVFRFTTEAIADRTVQPLMWFDSPKPLRSGWAWGQSYLQDGVAAFKASIGQGELYVFGPEITFRAQAHGTFKLLFNQLYIPDAQ